MKYKNYMVKVICEQNMIIYQDGESGKVLLHVIAYSLF